MKRDIEMQSIWLGRFRIRGTNWEGREWFLTPGGVELVRAVNTQWPEGHAADGTVASEGHDTNNPTSDHRPSPHDESPAVVRALDVGERVEDEGFTFAEMLRESKDPRIQYVLHENRIFSSYSRPGREPWTWANGSFGHINHVHVSFTERADWDNTAWFKGGSELTPEQEEVLEWAAKLKESYESVGSNEDAPRFFIPWFRKWSAFDPENVVTDVEVKRG